MTRKVTPAQIKAVTKYEAANYDKILLRLPKGERENIQQAASAVGQSVNAYIRAAIEDYIGSAGSQSK